MSSDKNPFELTPEEAAEFMFSDLPPGYTEKQWAEEFAQRCDNIRKQRKLAGKKD